jgi:DNA-directed RNA polymerase
MLDEILNKDGRIRDITDLQKAVTSFAVNGNHSNDAVIVRKFHLWGRKNNIGTSTIHDAFFTNAADLLLAKEALRESYAQAVDANVIQATLFEMLKRGMPFKMYKAYLDEAKDLGLIPVAGRSKIGTRVITEDDILKSEDIRAPFPKEFWRANQGWYGIGP